MECYKVYMHITPNDKKYIGITSRELNERWGNGKGYKTQVFGRAINKYGWNNIKHIIIDEDLNKEEAIKKEIELIEKYDTTNNEHGYNMTEGGEGSTGFLHTEKSKMKIRKARAKQVMPKGRKLSEEAKRKIGDANKGNTCYWKGKTLSIETREKISESRKEFCRNTKVIEMMRDVNPNKKKVYQYNSDGQLIKIWKSRRQAEDEFRKGKRSQAIGKCCIGNCNSAYGFYWSYKPIKNKHEIPQSYRTRKVYQYDKEGDLIKTWKNLNTAVNEFREGTKSQVIRQNVCGMRDKAYGYIWKYE